MRVLLVDADSTRDPDGILRPNLVLMKLSAHHKARGDEVGFAFYKRDGTNSPGLLKPENVYVLCVFTDSNDHAVELREVYPNARNGVFGYEVGAVSMAARCVLCTGICLRTPPTNAFFVGGPL